MVFPRGERLMIGLARGVEQRVMCQDRERT